MGIARRTYPDQDSGDGNVFAVDRDGDKEPVSRPSVARVSRLVRLLPKQRIDAKPETAAAADDVAADPDPESSDTLDSDGLIYLEALRIRGLVSESDYNRRRAEIRRPPEA